ncbi:hypothetical protein HPB51_008574 [Rhipicephalus microplus]|uniref:Uncharacterized protein n=1 Tax=Rhipicephalus microplus TaxID=6941 RepID=A0A9J6E8J2_RHIMP|nr:hypothetical protein HPB51_008574 [Rhipicephalus microplus]
MFSPPPPPATTESAEVWHTVYYEPRRKPGHKSVKDADGVHGAKNKVEPGFGNTHAKTQEKRMSRIEKASRMPKLPAGDYKIVIPPRGGLRVAAFSPTDITRGIHEAANTPPEVRHVDLICLNKTQSIMIVRTPDPDQADQYRKIKKILIRGQDYDVAAYETAPEITAKNIIEKSHWKKLLVALGRPLSLKETTSSSWRNDWGILQRSLCSSVETR